MGDKTAAQLLAQHWTHSHEEDTDTEMVFRPASYKFPPSRGRSSFDLRPDGAVTESGPGADDRTQHSEGKWHLDAHKNLVLSQGSGGRQSSRVLKLASVDPHRLVIKK